MRRLVAIGCGVASLLCASAHAQVAPQINPGVIQNDVNRQRQQFEQQSETPKLQGPGVVGGERGKTPKLKPGGPKFKLRKLEFDPSKFLTPQGLDKLPTKYVGKRIDIASPHQIEAYLHPAYPAPQT